MFHESLEGAWLDKVDRRYAWLRRTLVTYEVECLLIFPTEWGIPERVTMQVCNSTRYVGRVLPICVSSPPLLEYTYMYPLWRTAHHMPLACPPISLLSFLSP